MGRSPQRRHREGEDALRCHCGRRGNQWACGRGSPCRQGLESGRARTRRCAGWCGQDPGTHPPGISSRSLCHESESIRRLAVFCRPPAAKTLTRFLMLSIGYGHSSDFDWHLTKNPAEPNETIRVDKYTKLTLKTSKRDATLFPAYSRGILPAAGRSGKA